MSSQLDRRRAGLPLPLCPNPEALEGWARAGKGLACGVDRRSRVSGSYFGGRLVGLLPPLQPPQSAAHSSSRLDLGLPSGWMGGCRFTPQAEMIGSQFAARRDPPSPDPSRALPLPPKHPPTRGRPRGESQRPKRASLRQATAGRRVCALPPPADWSEGFQPPETAVPLRQRDSHQPSGPGWELARPPNTPTDKRSRVWTPGALAQRRRMAGGARTAGSARRTGRARSAQGARGARTCALRAPGLLREVSRSSAAGN